MKPDNGCWLATRLKTMPTLVLHSTCDATCQQRKEEPLWDKLAGSNPNFQLNLSNRINHCSMYERAYCDTAELYAWLLQFNRDEP